MVLEKNVEGEMERMQKKTMSSKKRYHLDYNFGLVITKARQPLKKDTHRQI